MELNDFEKCFVDSIVNVAPEEPYHRFSLRYRIRKRKIIKDYKRSLASYRQSKRIRLKYLLIAVIVAGIAILAGFGAFKIIEGFRVTDYDIYSMLYVVDDLTHSPDTIEEKFYIDMDMSEYEVSVVCDDFTEYWLKYKNEEITLSISQVPVALFDGTSLNTENCYTEPQQILINGWNGLYFQPNHGGYYFVFNAGEYIISYTSNMPKTEIENIVKSTKFK